MKKLLYLFLAITVACSSGDDSTTPDSNDTTPPVITLIGSPNVSVTQGDNYTDEGATATDNVDGDLTSNITVSGNVDTATIGNYILTYNVSDSSGNSASVSRTITVVAEGSDVTAPVITITGNAILDVTQYETYVDAGATATDDVDGDITALIEVSGSVDTNTIGTYIITYSVSDSAGNLATATRNVNVVEAVVCANGEVVYLDANGVTIKACPDAQIGDTGNVNGFTYTIVSEQQLRDYVNSGYLELNRLVTTQVTNMGGLFLDKQEFNQDISSWDTSNVTNMSAMFYSATLFNQPIGDWDLSSVTDISGMFYRAISFNQPIGGWNTGNVTNMSGTFYEAQHFDQPIGNWNTGNVTDMSAMFSGGISYFTLFNQDISNWDTSNVTIMTNMFKQTALFNQDISGWDVSNVTDMEQMFMDAQYFNQPIGNWNVSSVTNISYMFKGVFTYTVFNQDLSNWNVSQMTKMRGVFHNASSFNQDISSWDVSGVTDMREMFKVEGTGQYIGQFNQDLSVWQVDNVTACSGFAYGQPNWTLPKPNFTNC